MSAVADWWDGIELWITGLPFVPQALVVAVVLVPAAFAVAALFDRVLADVLRLLGRDTRAEREVSTPATDPSITEGH